jgi:hypothetical protein
MAKRRTVSQIAPGVEHEHDTRSDQRDEVAD